MTTPTTKLRPVTGGGSLRTYISELRGRSDFIRSMPEHDLHAQNMDTVLGNLWYLANPLLSMLVYWLIFGLLLDADRGVESYVTYLVIGILVFQFFTQAAVKAAGCIGRNETLIRSLYFPRAAIPLASTLGSFYVFVPSILVIGVVAAAQGIRPTWRLLLLPVALAILVLFVTGAVLILARLGNGFRDLPSLLPHFNRLGFYASGTLYDPANFTDNELVLWIFDLNPLYELLSLVRWCVMARPIPAWFWLSATAWSLVLVAAGFVFFWKGELHYGSRR